MPRQSASAALSVERFFELSLIGLTGSGFLAVTGSGHLDPLTIGVTTLALILRALRSIGALRFTIPDRASAALTLGYVGFFPLDYYFVSQSFLTAVVHLVFFLAAMKLLTARSSRDYLFLAIISFLELLAAAILSAYLNFFLFLAAYLLFAACAFTSGEIRRSIQTGQHIARTPIRAFQPRLALLTGVVAVLILALTSGLFFLLPRTADAAFRHLIAERYYLPGFSNQVTLGQIGQVKMDSRPVMHVRFYRGGGPHRWRGASLAEFDGKRWYNPVAAEPSRTEHGMVIIADETQRRRAGRRSTYRVDLHAIDTDALFFAGLPEYMYLAQRTPVRSSREGWRLGFAPPDGFRYEASSFVEIAAETALAPEPIAAPLKQYLQLPPLDARIPPLARELAGADPLPAHQARAIELALRTRYAYTLELPARQPPDPLAHFLFERRQGHCEYFASAMAVMLRTLGTPARLVNGFQSGTHNPISDLWLIRASDAHSWVEAWLPGGGWTAFDPTPPDPNPRTSGFLARLALYLDAAETFWRDWVLSYDLGRQVTLVSRVERSGRRFRFDWFDGLTSTAAAFRASAAAWLSRYGLVVLAAALVAAALWFTVPKAWRLLRIRHGVRRMRRGQASMADAAILYHRMLELLRRRGYQKPPWLTASEFSNSLPPSELRELVRDFSSAYHAVRFGGRASAALQLTAVLDRLERQG
jgi:transglutaminase-like putative cysteine protease